MEREVRLTYSAYGPDRQYFNTYLSVADAIVQTAGEMANADACMVEMATGAVHGGEIQALARLSDAPHAFVGTWLVAVGDARSARNHTWHLRGPLAEGCDPRAARIFGGRRNGLMTLV
jgi:hypothetical protein